MSLDTGASATSRVAAGGMIFLGSVAATLFVMRFVDHPLATIIFNKRIHGAVFRVMTPEMSDISLLAASLLFVMLVGARVSRSGIGMKAIGLSLASAAIAHGSTNYLFKPLFGRSGPATWIWHGTDVFHFFSSSGGAGSFYFPSGHTAFVTALMMSLATTLPEFRAISVAVSLFAASAVVLLEEHFLSDALAGVIVGTVAAWIVSWAWSRLSSLAAQFR